MIELSVGVATHKVLSKNLKLIQKTEKMWKKNSDLLGRKGLLVKSLLIW
jgi:hypothetical protein